MRAMEAAKATAARPEARRVRPREVWRDLGGAARARVRETFVRVLLEALGAAAAPSEGGGDASGR